MTGFAHRPHRFVVPFHGGGLPRSEASEAPADAHSMSGKSERLVYLKGVNRSH